MQHHQQPQRSSPSTATGPSTTSSPSTASSAIYANESTTSTTANRSSTPSNSHSSSHLNASNNNQLNPNSSSSNSSHTNPANGNGSNSLLPTSVGEPPIQPHAEKLLSQVASSASSTANTSASNFSSLTTSAITSGTHVIETVGMVSVSNFQSNQATTGGQSQPHLATGGGTGTGNTNQTGSNNSSSLTAGTSTEHGHGTPSSNNTSSNSNNAVVVTHTSKKLRSSQPSAEIPSPSNSRTPDNSFGSSSSFGGGGGLKFSYEAQPGTNPTSIGATSTIITPQAMVKESPPSSPGSDSGMARSNKRNRKLSTNSNAALGAPEAKESKLFQNGVVHATHMLGNQLNPNSSVAQKMSDQLSMELETHSFVETAPQIVGPPFPGKSQAVRFILGFVKRS